MGANETGQLIASAAQVYEQFFVPALFKGFSQDVLAAAETMPGDQVLDVACGTGILARTAKEWVGSGGSVTGLDINEGMLAVAQEMEADIHWKKGRAEALPFRAEQFDVVVSQFGLMFFEDQVAAIQEMLRVLRPGRKLAIAVWGPLQNTPGYAALADLLGRLFGEQAARSLDAPYALGDPQLIQSIFSLAGFPHIQIENREGTARFPSIREWMFTEIKGWTLADQIDDRQYALLEAEAEAALQEFVQPGGSVAFAAPAQIISLLKP